MKRHLIMFATLTALALPALVEAGSSRDATVRSGAEQGVVDATALTNLLVEKGLVTPQEHKMLTHPQAAPAVDSKTMREVFRSGPYQSE